jgi:hypothetical protein
LANGATNFEGGFRRHINHFASSIEISHHVVLGVLLRLTKHPSNVSGCLKGAHHRPEISPQPIHQRARNDKKQNQIDQQSHALESTGFSNPLSWVMATIAFRHDIGLEHKRIAQREASTRTSMLKWVDIPRDWLQCTLLDVFTSAPDNHKRLCPPCEFYGQDELSLHK